MTRVRGADVGHRSGKGRNKLRGIMVKTTVVGFLTGPDANFKHMSQEIKNNKKGRTLSNTKAARLRLRSSSVTNSVSHFSPSEMRRNSLYICICRKAGGTKALL